MPTVPIIPTVGQDPVRAGQFQAGQVAPVVAQQPQLFQQAGQAMERSGEQWQQLEAMQRRRIDIAAHTERMAAIGEQDTNALLERQRLQGKAAVESFDGWVKELDKRYKAALDSAPEGQQREWLRRELAQSRQSLFNSAAAHREKELLTWRKGSTSAAATQSVKAAIAMLDAEDRQDYINKAIAATMESAEVNGLSDEERNLAVKGALSQIHGESLRTLVQNDRNGEAAEYLAKHRLDLDPAQRGDFEALVKRGVTRDVAYTLAAATLQEAGGDPYKALARLEQERQAGKIDAETTAAAEQRVRVLYNDEANRRAVADAQTLTEAESVLAQNPGKLLSDFPALYEAVAKTGKLPQILQFERTGRYSNSPEVLNILGNMSQQELAGVSEEQFDGLVRGNLNPSLAAVWKARHRVAIGKASSADRSIISMDLRINKAAREVGIITTPVRDQWDEEQAKRYEDFQFRVNDQLEKWQAKNRREPSDAEIQSEIIDPMVKNEVQFGGERRSFASLSADEQGEAYVVVPGRAKPIYLRDIPPHRIREISLGFEEGLRSGIIPAGKKLNWDAIGFEYARMLADGRAVEGEASPPQSYSELPLEFQLMPSAVRKYADWVGPEFKGRR